jgi:hypothetical protein
MQVTHSQARLLRDRTYCKTNVHHATLAPESQVRFTCASTGEPTGVRGRGKIVATCEPLSIKRYGVNGLLYVDRTMSIGRAKES